MYPRDRYFAFLGANGAGKSTTIGCITTVLRPTSGTIQVQDRDAVEDPYGSARLSASSSSRSWTRCCPSERTWRSERASTGYGRREASARIGELAELVGLEDFLDRRYGVLSGGQKRRADIARAIVHRPSVVFLDEPTAASTPSRASRSGRRSAQLRTDHSTTVFLTTHYMEETERADQVCIISEGRIMAEGTPAHLRSSFSRSVLTVRTPDVSSSWPSATRGTSSASTAATSCAYPSTGGAGEGTHPGHRSPTSSSATERWTTSS